jgi:threonine dehydrogenase-like Zn-dependent dehydrogenase
MKALVFDLSIPKYLVAKAVGPKAKRLHYGKGTCFSLRDVKQPTPPDRSWAAIAPELVGVCGTDLATIFFKLSPALSAVSSTPTIVGHEVYARVAEPPEGGVDAMGRPISEGARVAIEPFVGCAARGLPQDQACASCLAGSWSTCERAGTGPRKGVMLGAGVELPGAFAERSIAHHTQLHSIEGRLKDDRVAALVEPLAIAVQCVASKAKGEGRALVIGGGPIGLAVVWALERLRPNVEVTLLTLEKFQLDHATRLGAEHTLTPSRDTDVLEQLARETGSAMLKPVLGRSFLSGGYDIVFDCVGLPSTLDDALRATRPRGTVVLAGCQGIVPKIDLTFVWSRELTLLGTVGYGYAPDRDGVRRRTFDLTIDLMAEDEARLAPLITHVIPIDRYDEAIEACIDRRASSSVKVLIDVK